MDTVKYETARGRDVLAAFNADFFDMFGDCAPSGLCVKDGVIVANPQSDRYFFAVKKDGTHIIDTLAGKPRLLSELDQAVCGLNLLLDQGEVCDVSAGEYFGTRTHPRTVVGLTDDGRVVILVIDGRRPGIPTAQPFTNAPFFSESTVPCAVSTWTAVAPAPLS